MQPINEADDIGTIVYQCPNNHQSTNPITKEQRDRSEALRKRLEDECKPENIKKLHEEAKQKIAKYSIIILPPPMNPDIFVIRKTLFTKICY